MKTSHKIYYAAVILVNLILLGMYTYQKDSLHYYVATLIIIGIILGIKELIRLEQEDI